MSKIIRAYNALRNLFPKRKSDAEEALSSLYEKAPKGNMSPSEVYKAFDYDDDKPWLWKNKGDKGH